MSTLYRRDLEHITRREFLQLSAAGLLAALLMPARLSAAGASSALAGELALPCQGRVLQPAVRVYSEAHERSAVVRELSKDTLVDITHLTLANRPDQTSKVWYGLGSLGYTPSAVVQPVQTQLNPLHSTIAPKGFPAVVTVPFTDTIWDHRLAQPHTACRLYYGAVVWVTATVVDQHNQAWYYLSDEWTSTVTYYGKPEHFHIMTAEEMAPLSPEVDPRSKRIEVRLKDQVMIAYEGERPVFMSRVSTGTAFGDQTYYTPPGVYATNGKFPSRHMVHTDRLDENAYDLPGVPWACYITSNGIAFHGTYWHNDFGQMRSHGCINLNLEAARWVYRWTTPSAPLQERIWLSSAATRVDVIA